MREEGSHLAGMLAPALAGDGPLYRQLAEALKRAIDRGELALGTVLPPERTLARALAVSRSTVVAAYDRLKSEGWLESRQGSGTWVRGPEQPDHDGVDAVATARLFLTGDQPIEHAVELSRRPLGDDEDVADLAVAATAATPEIAHLLADLRQQDLAPLLAHHGYLPHGLHPLRELIASRFTASGLPTDPDQVLVTTGAHQAISLVARQTVDPGDTVLVESPTFPGALDIFRRFGARALPLPVDADGARTDVLADLLARTRPKAVYLTPHFHNPTGCVLSEERRREIGQLVDGAGTVLIEDLALADLAIDEQTLPPPVAAFTAGDTVHTVGSASKAFWAGLRIGWVRSPTSWSTRMLSTKTVADLGSPLIEQLLTARLLEQADGILDGRRTELRERRDQLCSLLDERLPSWSYRRPPGGLSVWAQLPDGNAHEFAEIARRFGVSVIPGPSLSVDDGNRRALRLVFARPEATIDEGVQRLAAAWGDYAPATSRPPARLLV